MLVHVWCLINDSNVSLYLKNVFPFRVNLLKIASDTCVLTSLELIVKLNGIFYCVANELRKSISRKLLCSQCLDSSMSDKWFWFFLNNSSQNNFLSHNFYSIFNQIFDYLIDLSYLNVNMSFLSLFKWSGKLVNINMFEINKKTKLISCKVNHKHKQWLR